MIDEKIVIKDIENRIDTFVKQYPKEKDCRSVQVQREFIHILELAAKKQKAKEHERMLSIESELLGTLNDMKDSKEDFCDKQGGKCELYESCFKCAVVGIVDVVKRLEEEAEYSSADFDGYVKEVAPYLDAEYDDIFYAGLKRAIMVIRAVCREKMPRIMESVVTK